jgi:hypothetical protein
MLVALWVTLEQGSSAFNLVGETLSILSFNTREGEIYRQRS